MKRHPRRNDPEIYDNLLYVGMNETGNVLVPMTGWDVQQIACGSYTAVGYARDEKIQKWMSKYSDEQLSLAAKPYAILSETELNNRQKCIELLIAVLANEIYDYEMPNIYLATDKMQKEWYHFNA
jgi:hypothetical protein